MDRGYNIFAGITKNLYFIVIWLIMIGGQILIVFVGGVAFSVVPINGRDWAISIVVAFMSIPLGALIRTIPTEPVARFLYKIKLYRDPATLPDLAPEAEEYEWNEAIQQTIGNMSTFANIRGARSADSVLSRFCSKHKRADFQVLFSESVARQSMFALAQRR